MIGKFWLGESSLTVFDDEVLEFNFLNGLVECLCVYLFMETFTYVSMCPCAYLWALQDFSVYIWYLYVNVSMCLTVYDSLGQPNRYSILMMCLLAMNLCVYVSMFMSVTVCHCLCVYVSMSAIVKLCNCSLYQIYFGWISLIYVFLSKCVYVSMCLSVNMSNLCLYT